MQPIRISLSEHLKGFSAVKTHPNAAAAALNDHLQQFGQVVRTQIDEVTDSLSYLTPIKSFVTRYLILGLADWSLLLADMRGANCYVEAFAISRAISCNAIGLFLQREHRELQLLENGKKIRRVQSLRDGDKWIYREEGPLQPFEDVNECLRKRKKERLQVDALTGYFESYTGHGVPDWKHTDFSSIIGLERSTKDLRVQIIKFETSWDV